MSDIWKEREKIQQFVTIDQNPNISKKRCVVRDVHFGELDRACYLWFVQQRTKGAPVSGPLIQEKSLQLFPQLYPHLESDSFKASSGWLQKFCNRHAIKAVTLQGESLSADVSAVEPFRLQLQFIMRAEGYTSNQVFNADETGIYWRMIPSKSLVLHEETNAKNFQLSKDRVTLLACANASGTCRLPLAFVHKSVKPRCFKHMNMDTLPVHYFAQNNSWMNSKLFLQWFQIRFLPHVKLFHQNNGIENKALLLIDNAPAHPSISWCGIA